MRKLLAVLGTAALLGLGAVSCSSESDDDPNGEEQSSGTTADEATGDGSATTSDESGDESSDSSADESGGGSDDEEAVPPEDVLGSATGRLRANPSDPTLVPLRLDVVSLERVEGLVELQVVLTHEGDTVDPSFQPVDAFDDPRLSGSGEGRLSLSGATLVDAEGERAYLTVVDSEGICLCTGDLDRLMLEPGDSQELYARFGGVPGDLDQVSIQVPGFEPIDAVPIAG